MLAPGSRSAPLAYALADAARPDAERPAGAPSLRLHVRIDERSAAFLALGLARASAHGDGDQLTRRGRSRWSPRRARRWPTCTRPCSRRTTAGVPLLLLTADRPHELRGTGANQTTDQVGIFGRRRAARPSTSRPPSGARRGARACAARSPAPWPLPRARAPATRAGAPRPRVPGAARCPATPRGRSRRPPGSRCVQARHVRPAVRPREPCPRSRTRSARASRRGADRGRRRRRRRTDRAPARRGERLAAAGRAVLGRARRHRTPSRPTGCCWPTRCSGGAVRRVVVLGRPTLSRPGAAAAGARGRRGGRHRPARRRLARRPAQRDRRAARASGPDAARVGCPHRPGGSTRGTRPTRPRDRRSTRCSARPRRRAAARAAAPA